MHLPEGLEDTPFTFQKDSHISAKFLVKIEYMYFRQIPSISTGNSISTLKSQTLRFDPTTRTT